MRPLALLALVVALGSAGPAGAQGPDPGALPAPGSYELPPIATVRDHRVLDSRGEPGWLLGLGDEQVALVAFVYAHCPSACPAAMAVLEGVDARVAGDEALRGRVRLVALSFDPERDTPESMAAWRDRFAPASDWRFLTAAGPAEIEPILDDFGQSVQALVTRDGHPTPLLRHVLKVYLVDREQRVRNVYTSGFMTAELLLTDLRTLLGERPIAAR